MTSAPGRWRRGPGSRASCARPGMQAGEGALIWRRSACCTNTRTSRLVPAAPVASSSRSQGRVSDRVHPLLRPLPLLPRPERGSAQSRGRVGGGLSAAAYCPQPIGYSPPSTPQLIHARQPRAILTPVPPHRGRASKAFWCGGGIGRSGNHCGHAPHILGGRRDPCSETGGQPEALWRASKTSPKTRRVPRENPSEWGGSGPPE